MSAEQIEQWKVIKQAEFELENRGDPVDVVTISAYLDSIGQIDAAGGPHFLHRIAQGGRWE